LPILRAKGLAPVFLQGHANILDALPTLRTLVGCGEGEIDRLSSPSISSAARFAETERVTGRRRGGLKTSTGISSSLELPTSSSERVVSSGRCVESEIDTPELGEPTHFAIVVSVIGSTVAASTAS
jgi:hypothetical protein